VPDPLGDQHRVGALTIAHTRGSPRLNANSGTADGWGAREAALGGDRLSRLGRPA
jgi:hypothetical protein